MAAASKRRKQDADKQTPGAIVAHPLRSRCLTILADRRASAAEIAAELKVPVGNVSYHVRTLLKAGAVEPVGERRVRGAVETYFRAVVQPCVSDAEFAKLSPEEREGFARLILSLATANATSALDAGTFTARPDQYIARSPIVVDEQGWRDLGLAYQETFDRVYEIQSESAERRSSSGERGIPAISFVTFFEMPPASQAPDRS